MVGWVHGPDMPALRASGDRGTTMTGREWDEIWAMTPTAEAPQPPMAGLFPIPGQRDRVLALDDLAG